MNRAWSRTAAFIKGVVQDFFTNSPPSYEFRTTSLLTIQKRSTLHSKTKEHNNLRKQKVPKVCLEIDARGSYGSKYVFVINDFIYFLPMSSNPIIK